MTRGDSVVAAVLAVLLFVHLAKAIDRALPEAAHAPTTEGDSAIARKTAGGRET